MHKDQIELENLVKQISMDREDLKEFNPNNSFLNKEIPIYTPSNIEQVRAYQTQLSITVGESYFWSEESS